MEKNIHRIRLRVFFRTNDEEESNIVNQNYKKLMPFDETELDKIEITNKNSEGLLIREVIITKNKLCDKFFKNLLSVLEINNYKEQLLKELDLQIDEAFLDFYLRLDKNTLKPVTGGNCFHIKITPAAFPKTRETVKKKMIELLNKTDNV